MAHAMFAGRGEFVRTADGRWMLSDIDRTSSLASPAAISRAIGAKALPGEAGYSRMRSTSAASSESLRDLSYVVVDTETTGGRAWSTDRITEIAAVVVHKGEIIELFETLVNPQRSIPYFVTQLTNITWDMVKDAPTFDRVVPDLMRVLEG